MIASDSVMPLPKEAAKAKTGELAVQQSKRDRAQQETVRVESEPSSAAVRKVGEKTFYLRDDVFKNVLRVPRIVTTDKISLSN